jgi:DNA-binding response OmpR family regulator
MEMKESAPAPDRHVPVPERPRRALVVEDEPHIRELVALHLRLEGLDVAEAGAGDAALRQTEAERFDLVVLDLMLPRVDGVTVCREIRRQRLNADVPILMLTARREETDKVLGLDSGADDYLTKPFGIRELLARARALLRRPRADRIGPPGLSRTPIAAGALRIDPARRQATVDGAAIDLTPHEFDVLHLLASHPGIVFTREMLLARIWTEDTHVTERSVDTLVKRLRQKIEADTRDPRLILTVWGTGYKFADV